MVWMTGRKVEVKKIKQTTVKKRKNANSRTQRSEGSNEESKLEGASSETGAAMAPAVELPLTSLEGYVPAWDLMGSGPNFGVPSLDVPSPVFPLRSSNLCSEILSRFKFSWG
jgi:hypothetical protein